MSNQFLAEIRIFSGNFAPTGWAQCNGQLMPISQNTALFSLLGTTYGGDGKSTFALPNLQGSAPMQQGQGPGLSLRSLGENEGETAVTLLSTEMPAHNHGVQAASGTGLGPGGNIWGSGLKGTAAFYIPSGAGNVNMSQAAVSFSGGGQPHNNMMPYLGLTFIIALQGIYPPRT